MFDDIDSNDLDYFIGSIICISGKSTNQNQAIIYQVIDGQQRLTTISILLLAIIDELGIDTIEEKYGKLSVEYGFYLTALRMLRYDDKDKESFRLIPQEGNKQDFHYLVRVCLDKNDRNNNSNDNNSSISDST